MITSGVPSIYPYSRRVTRSFIGDVFSGVFDFTSYMLCLSVMLCAIVIAVAKIGSGDNSSTAVALACFGSVWRQVMTQPLNSAKQWCF